MDSLIQLTDEISYLASTRKPFCCDIIFIKPKQNNPDNITWVYDVGTTKEARDLINAIDGTKVIVISHFHPDHILNVPFIKFNKGDELIVSKYTKHYTLKGNLFENLDESSKAFSSDYNIRPQIYMLPSSHAKGCLCLHYKDYSFMGDGTYCKEVRLHHSYNAQLLREEIDVLKSIDCKYFCLDHDPKFSYTKEELSELHESIYSRREKNNATISVEDFFNPDGSVKTPEQLAESGL